MSVNLSLDVWTRRICANVLGEEPVPTPMHDGFIDVSEVIALYRNNVTGQFILPATDGWYLSELSVYGMLTKDSTFSGPTRTVVRPIVAWQHKFVQDNMPS